MIKVGVLGFAHGHVQSFGKNWMEHPEMNVRITAGWDHDAERCKASCERLEAKACESAEALLKEDIQAVVVTCETKYHPDMVELAAAAGKDIILYKPMALTMRDADRIVDAVKKNGVRLVIAPIFPLGLDSSRVRSTKFASTSPLVRSYFSST